MSFVLDSIYPSKWGCSEPINLFLVLLKIFEGLGEITLFLLFKYRIGT
jgi:hypothetical protein